MSANRGVTVRRGEEVRGGNPRVDVYRSEETHRHLASLGVSITHPLSTSNPPLNTRHERRYMYDRESPLTTRAPCDKSAGSAMLAEARLLVHGISRVSCLPVVRPGTHRITRSRPVD